MKVVKQVILRTIAGESMLVPIGETVNEYNGLFLLTESGKLLWEAIQSGKEGEELASVLVENYGIELAEATQDTKDFVDKLIEMGIVE
jgi:hypothetical protein